VVTEVLTKAQRKAAKRAAKQVTADTTSDVVETVITPVTHSYATLYGRDEEREHYLRRAIAAVLLAVPALGGGLANVRISVTNINAKIGKGWKIDQANDGTGMVTVDGRINQGRGALSRALFGTLYAWTGYDTRALRVLAEKAGFVFGKGRATGWAGDITPELAQALDDVLSTLPEYPQRYQFTAKVRGRNGKGSKNATLKIHGSPTGDDQINGNVHGGRVFIAQLAADMAKAGYWCSIEDKETDAVLAAAEAKSTADQDNAINKALAA